jgi:hypothetical protein
VIWNLPADQMMSATYPVTKNAHEPNGINLGKAKGGGYSKFSYLQFNNFAVSTLFRA